MPSRKAYPVIVLLALGLLAFPRTVAAENIRLLLTTGIGGQTRLAVAEQESRDPLLLMAQSIIRERERKKYDLYLDLGNAFYPGALSRYSYGAIMFDFFESTGCRATLVSSNDIQIGGDSLEFQQRDKKIRLLSANIRKGDAALFSPFIEYRKGDTVIAIVGISSSRVLPDIAEKRAGNISIQEQREALAKTLESVRRKGIRHIILLSGLSSADTMALLKEYPQIGMVICGGDNNGMVHEVGVRSLRLDDGRSIIFLSNPVGTYTLDCSVGAGLLAGDIRFNARGPYKTADRRYRELVERLTLWKNKYYEEEGQGLARIVRGHYDIDAARVGDLLRKRFAAEIAIIGKADIVPAAFTGDIRRQELSQITRDNYSVFTYRISGADLKKIADADDEYLFSGYRKEKVQGYAVDDNRFYKIVSTQRIYDLFMARLDQKPDITNQWTTIADTISADLKSEQMLSKEDLGFVDNAFRFLIDVSLSNFFERAVVEQGEKMQTPPGKPTASYSSWGMEDRIDFTLYNRYHQFILTPYLNFAEERAKNQKAVYQQNLLRGTFVYNLNLDSLFRPYHKSQCDSVVRSVDGLRPTLLRETLGAYFLSSIVEGKLGFGFEKQVHDPVGGVIYGLEFIGKAKYEFIKNCIAFFNFDLFVSRHDITGGPLQSRSECETGLSFRIGPYLAFTGKYRWFNLYDSALKEKYSDSRIITAIDLKTDFKVF